VSSVANVWIVVSPRRQNSNERSPFGKLSAMRKWLASIGASRPPMPASSSNGFTPQLRLDRTLEDPIRKSDLNLVLMAEGQGQRSYAETASAAQYGSNCCGLLPCRLRGRCLTTSKTLDERCSPWAGRELESASDGLGEPSLEQRDQGSPDY